MPYSRKNVDEGALIFTACSSLVFGSSRNGTATKMLVTNIFVIRSNDSQVIV
jgi:hypothetical protein